MDKDVQKELGYFEKRMDMLKKKGTIPEDLLELIDFIYKRQLNSFALLNDILDKEVDFPSPEDVLRG